MHEIDIDLLKKTGYSDKAIDYIVRKVNVGKIEDADACLAYTGPCGDTMEISLKVGSGTIKDAKFRAIGCAASFASGSTLTEMIKGKTLDQAREIEVEEVLSYLGGIPAQKAHCANLAKETLRRTIDKYKENKKLS